MPYKVNPKQIISLCAKSLQYYDSRLVDHGLRVAYIADKLLDELTDKSNIDRKNLFLLSLFHDVGAYKTEEIDNMVEFETENVEAHSVYGYLFLKYLSPLSDFSEVLLYHHTDYKELKNVDPITAKYAQIIYTADRVDIAIATGTTIDKLAQKLRRVNHFDEKYIVALETAIGSFDENWQDNVSSWFYEEIDFLHITENEAKEYLKMIIQTIEFKSNVTMMHSINTTAICMFLSEKLNMSDFEKQNLYYGSLVHDIGKIAINKEVLEFNGRYTGEQMNEMKRHVNFTETILGDIFEEDIIKIATGHHEKLDGSGYPYSIAEKDLTLSQKIVVVADITSALIGKRTYKESYSWDKSIEILYAMAKDNLIDIQIVDIIAQNTEEISKVVEKNSRQVIEIYESMQTEYNNLIDTN